MATASTTVRTNFVGDASGLNRTLKQTRGEAAKTTKAAKGLDGAMGALKLGLAAIGGAAVGRGIMASISAASDLNETVQKAGVLFGQSADEVVAWSKTSAKAFGQSQQQALDAAATFATFGKSAGLSGKQLVGFSEQMVELASDMASFSNTSPEDAITAIGAAMRGEMEPIRKYGVLLDDASMRQEALAMGLIKTTKQALTPQQKVLAAQSLILKQTTAAQGDFARTSDGLANSQRILQAELADMAAELGQTFLPAMTTVVQLGTDALAVFTQIPPPVRNATLAFIGMTTALKVFGPSAARAQQSLSMMLLDIRTAPSKVGSLKAAVRGLSGAFGGPWMIAITAASAGLGIWLQKRQEAKARLEELQGAIKADSGALGENTRAWIANRLEQDGILKTAQAMGVSLNLLTDASLGNADAMAEVTEQTQAWAAANGANFELWNQQAIDVKKVTDAVGANNTAIQGQVESYKRQAAAVGDSAKATDASTDATADNTKVVEKAKTKYEKFTDAVNDAKKAMDRYLGINRDVEAAHRDAEEAVDDLTKSFKDNGKTLDITTAKGRANREAIEDLVEAAGEEARADKARGDSMKKVNKKYDERIQKIYDEADAHGVDKKAVTDYLTQLGLIPGHKTTHFKAPGLNDVARKVSGLARDWRSIVSGGPNLPPERAAGGPVRRGRPYVVGEKRPELFVPNQSGTILPSVPGGGGGQVVINMYGNVYGDDRKFADMVRRAVASSGNVGVKWAV